MGYDNTETPNMYSRLSSTTLSQLAFRGESGPSFPWEKSQWDNTFIIHSLKYSSQGEKAFNYLYMCCSVFVYASQFDIWYSVHIMKSEFQKTHPSGHRPVSVGVARTLAYRICSRCILSYVKHAYNVHEIM